MRFSFLAIAATLASFGTLTYAQPPAGMTPPIRGTVQSLQGTTLVLVGADGKPVTVTLSKDVRIQKIENKTIADLKAGEFVGCTSVLGSDGQRHATEVHVIPESQRGTGEGHRAMGSGQQTMTNGNVDGVVSSTQGETVTISYKGGAQKILVAPDTPVTAMVAADAAALKPGTQVNAMIGGAAPGGNAATMILIGKLPGR